jgi:hypothetical protein
MHGFYGLIACVDVVDDYHIVVEGNKDSNYNLNAFSLTK